MSLAKIGELLQRPFSFLLATATCGSWKRKALTEFSARLRWMSPRIFSRVFVSVLVLYLASRSRKAALS